MNSVNAHFKAAYEKPKTAITEWSEQPIEVEQQPRRNKIMTLKKLIEQIRFGYGQGHGKEYQSWLQIRRKNSTSKSNQVVAWMKPLGRVAHYFSRGEYKIALLLLWLGVEDLREQYPLWPIAHPHPLQGAEGMESMALPWVRGLMEVAEDADIDHGVEVGTNIPYVATIDLLVTLRMCTGSKLIGISCKPYSRSDAVIRPRSLERLELERRYFNEIDARYLVVDSALVPNLMAGQLELWMEYSVPKEPIGIYLHASSFAAFLEDRSEFSLVEAVVQAAKAVGIDEADAWQLFRYCAWHQLIDVDPTRPLLASHPIPRGGRAIRSELRAVFLGDYQQ